MPLLQDFRREDGFSLTELMVVVIIIGILALLAIPRFMSVTTKAKMTEAKTMLRQVHALQEGFYYEHDRYAPDLRAAGFEQSPLVTSGGNARYLLSIEQAGEQSFTALATAVVDFDRDGVFNVWAVNERGQIQERVAD